MNAKHTPGQIKVVVELCRSNSIGSNYHTPTVVSWQQCTKQQAAELLNKKMANGYFYRIKATGQNGDDAAKTAQTNFKYKIAGILQGTN